MNFSFVCVMSENMKAEYVYNVLLNSVTNMMLSKNINRVINELKINVAFDFHNSMSTATNNDNRQGITYEINYHIEENYY